MTAFIISTYLSFLVSFSVCLTHPSASDSVENALATRFNMRRDRLDQKIKNIKNKKKNNNKRRNLHMSIKLDFALANDQCQHFLQKSVWKSTAL